MPRDFNHEYNFQNMRPSFFVLVTIRYSSATTTGSVMWFAMSQLMISML